MLSLGITIVTTLFTLLAPTARTAHAGTKAEAPYFREIAHELKSRGTGSPVAVIDLDRLDRNIDAVKARVNGPLHLRIVEKSLPSPQLIKYILARAGTNRVMAFHAPFLKILLTELGENTDIVFGKTIPTAGVEAVLTELDETQRSRLSHQVTWLADTRETLSGLLELFKRRGLAFKVCLEVDVGLHRGGARNARELAAMLDLVRDNAATVSLAGLMGYDGHVPHIPVPDVFSLKLAAMKGEVGRVKKRFAAFTRLLRESYPELYAHALVFNGAGSKTYALYGPDSGFNDLSVGSGMLKPRDFDEPTLANHVPAVFIATPVLKKIHPATLPYLGRVSFRKSVDAYYVYGGGWSEKIEYPPGLVDSFLTRTAPNHNLVSNQTFLMGAVAEKGFGVGDFVFYRPDENDTIFNFEDILALRGGKVVETWHPFARRY